MEKIKIFENEEFGQVRTVELDNEIWFVGKDVARALGYKRPEDALARHVDVDDSVFHGLIDSMGRKQHTVLINESGLYSLILSSKLDSAKKFKKWVTSEVLPSIRKNGGYINNQENLSEAEILANAILVAQNVINTQKSQIHTLETKIELDKPKVIFADAVSGSEDSILIGQLAKLITQNGYEIGQKRLFQWLRDNNYIMKHKNEPYQKYIENGMFTLKEGSFSTPMAGTRLTLTTKVTPKGQSYFINKFSEMLVGA